MERAPLRPVPSRPEGPVDPHEAIGFVKGALPVLDEPAAQALALIELVGRPRVQVETEVGLGAGELATALARGRKELRRSLYPLAGSGWCERAERMISDRMDGVLDPPGPARLDAHLNGCERCLEHERRLAQAIDSLVTRFVETATVPEAQPPVAAAEPEPEPDLEPPAAATSPEPEPVEDGPPVGTGPPGEPAPPAAPVELRLVEPESEPEPALSEVAVQSLPEPPSPPAQPTVAAQAPVPAPEPPAPAVAPPSPQGRSSNLAAGLAWNLMLVFAVLLALATIGVAVAGALGASL